MSQIILTFNHIFDIMNRLFLLTIIILLITKIINIINFYFSVENLHSSNDISSSLHPKAAIYY